MAEPGCPGANYRDGLIVPTARRVGPRLNPTNTLATSPCAMWPFVTGNAGHPGHEPSAPGEMVDCDSWGATEPRARVSRGSWRRDPFTGNPKFESVSLPPADSPSLLTPASFRSPTTDTLCVRHESLIRTRHAPVRCATSSLETVNLDVENPTDRRSSWIVVFSGGICLRSSENT